MPELVASWVGLRLHSHLANTVKDIDRNIDYALTHDYVPFTALLSARKGAVAIVGSGPSLKKNWQKLKSFKGDILACNASCQFLLARGIVPTYMMCFDADPLMLEFITPHKDITYLLASRCPPEAFKLLEDCRIVCWHAAGDEHIEDLLEKHQKREPMVKGGTAAVTRALILALPMGYRNLHLWGADSSFDGTDTHIRQSTTVEKRMFINCGAKLFECSPWMAQQAEDFKALAPAIKAHGATLHVHGYGLIPHIARIMGFRVDGSRTLFAIRDFFLTLRFLWNTL